MSTHSHNSPVRSRALGVTYPSQTLTTRIKPMNVPASSQSTSHRGSQQKSRRASPQSLSRRGSPPPISRHVSSQPTTRRGSPQPTARRGYHTIVQLRRKLYTEAVDFSRSSSHSCYGLMMSLSNPTDPTSIVTKPDFDTSWEQSPPHPDQPQRDRWSSLAALLFVLICDDITTCIVSAPTASAFSNKGAGLYIMCAILWLLVGVPLLQFQYTMAQFLQSGPLRGFCLLHPRAGGIGFAIVILAFVRSFRVLRHSGESLIYIYGSLQKELPWKVSKTDAELCFSKMGNHDECIAYDICRDFDRNGTCYALPISPAISYYQEQLRSPLSPNPIGINLGISLSVLIAIFFTAIILIAGIRLLSQLATFTVICTMCILIYLSTISFYQLGGPHAIRIFFEQTSMRDFFSLNDWIGASVVILRMGVAAFGIQSIMTSYTRIGENVLLTAWAAAIILLLLSFFSILVVYAMEGMLYVDILTNGLTAMMYPDGSPADQKFIEQLVMNYLKGSKFRSTIEGYLTRVSANSLLFVLYPWGIARRNGSAIFSSIFYLCVTLMSIVSFACSVIIVTSALQETTRFGKTDNKKLVVGVLAIIYILSVPTFMNCSIDDTVIFGREFVLVTATSFSHYGSPIICAAQVVAACMILGWKRQNEVFPIYTGPSLFVSISIGVISGTLINRLTNGWVSIVVPALLFALFFVMVPVLLAIQGQSFFYRDNLLTLLVGDVEEVRETINGIMLVHRQPFYSCRLPYIWSWCFKYAVFAVFVSIIPSATISEIDLMPPGSIEDGHIPTADIIIGLVTALPILLVSIFPSVVEGTLPPPAHRWSLRKLNHKYAGKIKLFRRKPLRLWEEFLSSQEIWDSVFVLEQKFVHQ